MRPALCSALAPSIPPPCGRRIDRAGCDVELCVHATRIMDAIRLIHLGARAGLVCQLTKLEKSTANRLYRQLCGTPSPPGQTPFTDTWYRENDMRMLQATLVWRLHQRLVQTGRSPARIVIDVYEAYTRLVREPQLDLTRTVFVPRLVAMETWHERVCEFCGMTYLSAVDSNSAECPGCRLYHLHRCHHCGAPMDPQRRGRRRVVCGQCGNSQYGRNHH